MVCSTHEELESFQWTIYWNIFIFLLLMSLFEVCRHLRSIHLCRLKRKFIAISRVPMKPSSVPLGWLIAINRLSEDQFLKLAGLDAYMFLRFIVFCFRVCIFWTFFAGAVIMPVYSIKGNNCRDDWSKYTIGNIEEGNEKVLWTAVAMCYFFCFYFCSLLYVEYKNYVEKRLVYLVRGDPEIQPQAYYTVMVEKVPQKLRAVPELKRFFENNFPGRVFSVEMPINLEDLKLAAELRRRVRDCLEKSIAVFRGSGKRPYLWIDQKELNRINSLKEQRLRVDKKNKEEHEANANVNSNNGGDANVNADDKSNSDEEIKESNANNTNNSNNEGVDVDSIHLDIAESKPESTIITTSPPSKKDNDELKSIAPGYNDTEATEDYNRVERERG